MERSDKEEFDDLLPIVINVSSFLMKSLIIDNSQCRTNFVTLNVELICKM